MELEPITHLEKSIAGTVAPVTHLEKVIEQYGGGGGGGGGEVTPASIVTATGQMTEAQTDRMRANIVAAQDALRLTATPTAGPIGNTLMSGTWSGATWEQVVTAVLASRLIQIDVATVGKITLPYNLGSATNAVSNTVPYAVNGVWYTVAVELSSDGGNNTFMLLIISAPTKNVLISSTTPTIEPQSDTIYNCGILDSLTISNPPATGKYSIIFFSGATATATVGIENFVAEANKRYKIKVEDNYATYDSWPYTPT